MPVCWHHIFPTFFLRVITNITKAWFFSQGHLPRHIQLDLKHQNQKFTCLTYLPKLRRVDPHIRNRGNDDWHVFLTGCFWIYKILSKRKSMWTQFQSKMTFFITNPLSIPFSSLKCHRTFWSGAVLNFIWLTRFLPDMSGGPTDLRKHWLDWSPQMTTYYSLPSWCFNPPPHHHTDLTWLIPPDDNSR